VGQATTLSSGGWLVKKVGDSLDLLFLDPQIPGGSGLDLIRGISPATEIIFVTAHPGFAVKAFELNALDYIIKPVTSNRLAISVRRLLEHGRRRGPSALDSHLLLEHKTGQQVVQLASLIAVTSLGGNYTAVELASGDQPAMRRSLKEWELKLPSAYFQRVHRASIANLSRVARLQRRLDGTLFLHLIGRRKPLLVSRRRAHMVTQAISSLT